MKTAIATLTIVVSVLLAPQLIRADDQLPFQAMSIGQKRELVSAILCIDIDVQSESKSVIREEYKSAKDSGGGVIDMSAIHDAQGDFARAGREAAKMRGILSKIGVSPRKCSEVALTYNCINSRADQLPSSIDGEHCDIKPFGRLREAISSIRLQEPESIESNRIYTIHRRHPVAEERK